MKAVDALRRLKEAREGKVSALQQQVDEEGPVLYEDDDLSDFIEGEDVMHSDDEEKKVVQTKKPKQYGKETLFACVERMPTHKKLGEKNGHY